MKALKVVDAMIGDLDFFLLELRPFLQLVGSLDQVIVSLDFLLQLLQPVGDEGGALGKHINSLENCELHN